LKHKTEFKFTLLDKQEANEWVNAKELKQLQDLLYELVERYDEFPPLGGHPYQWTTDNELKDIGKRIHAVLNDHEDFFSGGVAHYNVDRENTFILSIVFSAKHKKKKVKRLIQHMICISINEERRFQIYKAY